MKYFEDIEIGDELESPRAITMTRPAIVEFANEWDPQRYHIDEQPAQDSPVGELFASAFHALAISQKLAHESGFSRCCRSWGWGSPTSVCANRCWWAIAFEHG